MRWENTEASETALPGWTVPGAVKRNQVAVPGDRVYCGDDLRVAQHCVSMQSECPSSRRAGQRQEEDALRTLCILATHFGQNCPGSLCTL